VRRGLPFGLPLHPGRIIRTGLGAVALEGGLPRLFRSALPFGQTWLSETSHSFFTLMFCALIGGLIASS
jgi:hypothetical protein